MPMGQSPDHQTVITEWTVDNHASTPASVSNRRELIRIDQPQSNHNGGTIEFGPDGFLYIGLGDGGSSNDSGTGHPSEGNSQAIVNPLGSVLRIDVDGNNSSNGEYGIPLDNPYVEAGDPGLDEAYAYGFRNPYRFSVNDLGNGDFELYVGDVGQLNIEEVSVIHSDDPGGNYGWKFKEGSFFFYDDNATCGFLVSSCVSDDPPQNIALPNMVDPIVEYDHDEGVSVIGGHVYKGSSVEGLANAYVFGEFLGRLFYIDQNQVMREFLYESPVPTSITAVGRDNQGELYFVGGFGSGVLVKVVQGEVEIDDELCLPIRAANGNLAVVCL
jgi:glucose/arabinose dehydrogenase